VSGMTNDGKVDEHACWDFGGRRLPSDPSERVAVLHADAVAWLRGEFATAAAAEIDCVYRVHDRLRWCEVRLRQLVDEQGEVLFDGDLLSCDVPRRVNLVLACDTIAKAMEVDPKLVADHLVGDVYLMRLRS